MLQIDQLPHLNAFLNAVSAGLLLIGFAAIKGGHKRIHMGFMISATVTSAIFLASYLTYHFNSPINTFNTDGAVKISYYVLLISHVVLAIANLPMIIAALYFAAKGNFERHPRIARWTLPIWIYVSISGVMVYVFLYKLNTPLPA